MKVCAASIKVTANSKQNLKRVEQAIIEAKKRKCKIICFPEVCVISETKDARSIQPEIKLISTWAKQNNISVIFGSYCIIRERLRNQLIAIDNNGTVKMRYNKRHPYIEEKKVVAGKGNKVFTLAKTPIALINCYDYAHPEEIRELARQGAKIIFNPTYLLSHPITSAVLERMPQVRAFDAQSYYVMVDAQAKETYGISRICHPTRELGMLKGEGLLIADLDLTVIPKLRRHFKSL